MSESTGNDVKWTDERLKDLKRTVESYFEKAAAAGRVVSPSGHFSGSRALCLVGALCLGRSRPICPRETAAVTLGLTAEEAAALEIGFDSGVRGDSWANAIRLLYYAEPSSAETGDLQKLAALGRELAAACMHEPGAETRNSFVNDKRRVLR